MVHTWRNSSSEGSTSVNLEEEIPSEVNLIDQLLNVVFGSFEEEATLRVEEDHHKDGGTLVTEEDLVIPNLNEEVPNV